MKTLTLKKMVVLLLSIPLFMSSAFAVVTHGSIKGTGVTLYAQGATGGNVATPIATATLDYKVVTKGSKTWAYLQFNGTSGLDIGADWTCQLRYWSSTNAKTENNMIGYRNATTKTIYGTATNTIPSPLNISFFQNLNPGGFGETLLIPYDVTAKNSPVSGDATAPVVTASDITSTETSATLTLTGSDNSGDLYYYIVDAAHGIEEFSLASTFVLNGLSASTTYNLTITPIDFNGNEGTPLAKSFNTAGLIQITSGIAQGIKFVLKSTTTQLEYYYEAVNPAKKFRDAFLQITPAGGTMFEIKPTISPDSTYAYGISTDGRLASKVLSLNCGYWFAPGLPDFSDYVISNASITSGTLSGTPIKHQMGGGISASESEATLPVLTSVSLVDATPTYIKLNINGSDNSGNVYYTISGAKSTVNAFRTGNYYLTAIDPGKNYTLSVKAYDLTGNTVAAKTVTVKTMPARTNIKDSVNLNYNTLVLPTAPGGELTTIIQQSGNTLTLGCTTKSLLIPAGNRNRVFNTPTVKINGTSYPLTIDVNNNTATVTFTGTIGTTPIVNGLSLQVQWSVFWGLTGGGNFFTGTFTLVIGDSGQTDISGPSTPVLTLTGNALTWPSCTDDLSGVKAYLVTETGQTPVTIFDLGGSSYSYTMVNAAAVVSVKAVDFIGNKSLAASKNDTGTANKELLSDKLSVYPNPATDRIQISSEVSEIAFYSLQGQLVHSAMNISSLDVSTFAKGLYIVRLTDKAGNKQSSKLEIR